MTTDVTVLGADGATVTIPMASGAAAQAAQAALGVISTMVQQGDLTQYNYPNSPPEAVSVGVVVTVPGLDDLGLLPSNDLDVVVNNPGNTTGFISGTAPNPTVVGGYGSSVVFLNQTQGAQVYFGGGAGNYFGEIDPNATAVVNVDGGSNLGDGSAYIDGAMGATTINLYNNALVNIMTGGGTETVFAQSGTSAVFVSGSSTVPVTVEGLPGANIHYFDNGGAGFINPTTGNVTIQGGTGTETLVGGQGSATVFGGTGSFTAGSMGGNVLNSSTVAGATTLVGGSGGNDMLANFGVGNTLIGGSGSATLASFTSATQGGSTYDLGSGNETVFGGLGGGNTFALGAGSATIWGQHGTTGTAANFYSDDTDGGNITIMDFLPQYEGVTLLGGRSLLDVTYYSNSNTSPFGSVGSQAHLSDGTTIDFVNAQVTTSNFHIG